MTLHRSAGRAARCSMQPILVDDPCLLLTVRLSPSDGAAALPALSQLRLQDRRQRAAPKHAADPSALARGGDGAPQDALRPAARQGPPERRLGQKGVAQASSSGVEALTHFQRAGAKCSCSIQECDQMVNLGRFVCSNIMCAGQTKTTTKTACTMLREIIVKSSNYPTTCFFEFPSP